MTLEAIGLRIGVPLLAVALLTAGAYASQTDAAAAGWEPLVSLFGSGDKQRAVARIGALNRAVAISVNNTRRDKTVQAFIDRTTEDLADFDLEQFHERLPSQNGDYRELWVRGEVKDATYVVAQATDKHGYAVSLQGQRNDLAAMSITVRAKETRTAKQKKAYGIGLHTGVGIGAIRWTDAMTSLQGLVRIGTGANPQADPSQGAGAEIATSSETKAKVRKLHPKLNREDLDVLGLLWDAYPRVSAELSSFGTVEDVRSTQHHQDHQQFTVLLRGQPSRFASRYPALASYFEKMGDIAVINMEWQDEQGRTLTRTSIDSSTLTFRFTCYVKDGYLLPSRGTTVYTDEPVDPMADTLDASKLIVAARIKLLGVMIKLDDLKIAMSYRPNPDHARVGLSLTKVPSKIIVEGAALGFLPTGLVDVFIPGNLESIARDFLTVMTQSNGGKGMTIAGAFGVRDHTTQDGVIEASVEFEALDNLLVKMGMGMVNERLVPNADAISEAKSFAAALQKAFARDFGDFAQTVTH